MLALQPPQQEKSLDSKTKEDSPSSLPSTCHCTPNILPCRIHHNGPLDSTVERYWNPTADINDGNDASADKLPTQIAYFRGRKLKGHRVPIPEGYKGVLATPTTRTLPASTPKPPGEAEPEDDDDNDDDEDEDEDEEEPTKILEQTSTFNEFVVWSHERAPVASEDPFIKGVEEWIQFAEVMHSNPDEMSTAPTATLTSRSKIPGESNCN